VLGYQRFMSYEIACVVLGVKCTNSVSCTSQRCGALYRYLGSIGSRCGAKPCTIAGAGAAAETPCRHTHMTGVAKCMCALPLFLLFLYSGQLDCFVAPTAYLGSRWLCTQLHVRDARCV
jgi:hypothetical protein